VPAAAEAAPRAASPALAALAAVRSRKAASPPPPPVIDDAPPEAIDGVDPAQKKTEQPAALTPATPSAAKYDWPALVKQLALRGVAQQLAMQSELLACDESGAALTMRIRVPVDTLLSAGSTDKLAAALGEHLGKTVRLDPEIGAASVTAHAADVAVQAERQRLAEQTLHDDPFVQTLMREFGATIVPGSIRPV
jgi:DNA polymerase-3 subunit gamma/tau